MKQADEENLLKAISLADYSYLIYFSHKGRDVDGEQQTDKQTEDVY